MAAILPTTFVALVWSSVALVFLVFCYELYVVVVRDAGFR